MVDISSPHVRDLPPVAALDMTALKLRRENAEVAVVGMNQASETIVGKLAVHDKPSARRDEGRAKHDQQDPRPGRRLSLPGQHLP